VVHETLEIVFAEGPGGNTQIIGETVDGGACRHRALAGAERNLTQQTLAIQLDEFAS